MQHAFKNLVIAAALLGAGFLVAWLYFRPHLGSQGSFTDGVREYQSVSDEPLRYALWDKGRVLQSLQDGNTRQFDPCLSPDGRWMVFAVGEPGLGTDLWIAPMQGQEPGPARALFEINGPADELAPAFSDGALYFASNREGGQGGLDLYRSSFDDGELGPVEALPDTINSPDQETDPAPMPGSDGLLFASNRKRDGLRNYDLYLVYGSGPSANKPSVLATLSAQSQDRDPALTADGRTLFFASDRGGPAGRYSLYRSVLDRGQWLEPATVQGLETSGSLRAPQPSPNGFQLLYSAENSGQGPSAQLFAARTRELFKKPGKTIGLFEVLLLLALLLLALLAWLAKRWTTMEVIYRCFLVSLIVHALLMWWFQDVVPENEPVQLADRSGTTFRVQLAASGANSTLAMQELAGELSTEEPTESPEDAGPSRQESDSTQSEAVAPASASTPELTQAPGSMPSASETEQAEPTQTASASSPSLLDSAEVEPLYSGPAAQLVLQASPSQGAPSPKASATLEPARPAPSGARSESAHVVLPEAPAIGLAKRQTQDLPGVASTSSPAASVQPSGLPTGVKIDAPVQAATAGSARAEAPSLGLGMPSPSELATTLTRPQASAQGNGPSRALGNAASGQASRSTGASRLGQSASGKLAKAPSSMPALASTGSATQSLPGPSSTSVALPLAMPAPESGARAEQQPGEIESAEGPVQGSNELALPDAAKDFQRKSGGSGGPSRFKGSSQPSPERATPRAGPAIADLGPSPVAAIDLPKARAETPFEHTPYQNRFGLAKERALEELGGSAETEAAVASGLAYLASIQNGAGFWGTRVQVFEKYRNLRIGKTGLCLLAFLGAGHTQISGTQYSPNLERAIDFLLTSQKVRTGHFGESAAYGHGIATYALAECYALTRDERLLVPLKRAVRHILDEQSGNTEDTRFYGGWSYYYPDGEVYDSWPRTSVTSWQVMALESARLAGLQVPEEALDGARIFLKNAWDGEMGAFRYNHAPSRLRQDYATLPASTPAAMFALSLLGEDISTNEYGPARMYLLERTPEEYRFDGEKAFVFQAQGNLYFWYYSSLALLRAGGQDWERWNAGLKRTLLPAQQPDGSWTPISIYAEYAGDNGADRSYTTAMCVLSLEVYYRYFTPLLKER